jgi:hypothetical protein
MNKYVNNQEGSRPTEQQPRLYFEQLVAGLSHRKPRFDPRPASEEFVVDKLTLRYVCVRVSRVPCR